MKKWLVTALVLMATTAEAAADGGVIPTVTGFVRQVGTFIDSMSVSGVDRRYIDAPEEPWQVIVRGNLNQTDLKMRSTVDGAMFYSVEGNIEWEPRIKTRTSAYTGIWAGYRGYGLGYSWNVAGDKGSILTFGAMGGSYGINLRIHRFETDEPEVRYEGRMLNETTGIYQQEARRDVYYLIDPIQTRTLLIDGYYMFNGKHFSYAAAYDQSVIQKRSAGSLMAGAMYYYSNTHYDSNENADFILMMNDIGRLKQWQLSLGVGYAYNWVPVKGLLVSVMAMPMLTCLNRMKAWRYDSNYREMAHDDKWHTDDELDFMDYEIWPMDEVSRNSRITLNYDTRLSLTYNWNRYFVNAYGQFNSFRYSYDSASGRLKDWFVYASVGVRL